MACKLAVQGSSTRAIGKPACRLAAQGSSGRAMGKPGFLTEAGREPLE
jgi:hypothetical protein